MEYVLKSFITLLTRIPMNYLNNNNQIIRFFVTLYSFDLKNKI